MDIDMFSTDVHFSKSRKKQKGVKMISPKIRIESDGTFTRLWINGEEIENVMSVDFRSIPFDSHLEYEKADLDDLRKCKHIVTERHIVEL